jgi:hypothetical protein
MVAGSVEGWALACVRALRFLENYCVWEFLALRQPNSAWLGLGVALANMLPGTAQGGMRSESAEVSLNAGAKPNAQA